MVIIGSIACMEHIAVSVLSNLFINGNGRCHTTDAPLAHEGKTYRKKCKQHFINVCCVMMLYVFCVVLCVSFCTGHFVMVPLNLTYLHCLQHSLFEHLFNLYYTLWFRWIRQKKTQTIVVREDILQPPNKH